MVQIKSHQLLPLSLRSIVAFAFLSFSLVSCNQESKEEIGSKLGENSTSTNNNSESDDSESGGGSSSEITLLTFNPSSYDFGAVTVNSSSNKGIIVTNSGGTEIQIGSVAISGDSAFTQTNTCTSILEAGATCLVSVTFSPVEAATKSALVTISYQDESQKSMSLIGSGGSNLVFNGVDNITDIGATRATLNWSAASGGSVSFYQVQRYNTSTSSWNVIATPSNTTTNYTDSSLSPGNIYRYRVYAYDSNGAPDGNTREQSAATSTVAFDPILSSDLEVEEESTTAITLSCSDSKGSSPTYSLVSVSDVDVGCSLVTNVLTCTPNNKAGHSDWTGTINLRCTIDGANLDYSPVLSVSDYSQPPVLTVPADRTFPNQVPVGSSVVLNSTAVDADGDTVTFACSVQSQNIAISNRHYAAPGTNCDDLTAMKNSTATFDESSGTLSWETSSSQVGTYIFTIEADDGFGGTSSDTFTIVTAEPFAQDTTTRIELDPRFADSGTGDGATSQTTTWSDISGNSLNGTILGTGSNLSNHWLGNGSSSSPHRLYLDGTDDSVSLDLSSFGTTSSYFTIYFKIPSSASDGTHPIVSFGETLGVAYIKGAGENRLYATSYSDNTATAYSVADTIELDTWYKLYFYIEGGVDNTVNGRKYVYFDNLQGSLDLFFNALRFDPQVGVGDNPTYLGYKPSAVGIATGPLAQGLDLYGEIEIAGFRAHTGQAGQDWRNLLDYYFLERLRSFPVGDARLTSLGHYFDPASVKAPGYLPFAEGTECESTTLRFMPGVTSEDFAYTPSFVVVTGASNPSCLSDNTGWRGSGGASNPYRYAFDGINDFITLGGVTEYQQSISFAPDTIENSFDVWFRPRDGENTLVANGYGRSIVLIFDNNWQRRNKVFLGLLDNSNGTSTLQLHLKNESETVDVTDTGVVVDNDTWNHAALTLSASGVVRLYLNGALSYTVGTTITDFTFIDNGTCNSLSRRCNAKCLGGSSDPDAEDFRYTYFAGDIALFRTYRAHELTAQDVSFLCSNDSSRFSGSSCD